MRSGKVRLGFVKVRLMTLTDKTNKNQKGKLSSPIPPFSSSGKSLRSVKKKQTPNIFVRFSALVYIVPH